MIWEEPPTAPGPTSRFRERSPLRKEVDTYIEELRDHPGQWARLYDMEDREEADKRANMVRGAAGKGWQLAVRETQYGWSVFLRLRPEDTVEGTEPEREPTFQ